MALTRPTIVGVFDDTTTADNAVQDLENRGFTADQIYYSRRHATGGGFLSGLKSLFTGDDTTGHISDDLTNQGLSADEARYYEDQYQAGKAIIALQANGQEQDAAQILQTNGARTYATRAGYNATSGTATTGTYGNQTGYTTDDTANTGTYANQTGYTTDDTVNPGAYANQTGYTTDQDINNLSDEQRRLRLREEQLNVNKQRVQAGEVGLHKDVVEEQKTINVPVTHEEVYVERRPVAEGQIDDTPIGQDETVRVPVNAEQVNVDKNTVVTGEVAVGKRPVQETQQVSDTVRREEARVDQRGDIPVHDTTVDPTNDPNA